LKAKKRTPMVKLKAKLKRRERRISDLKYRISRVKVVLEKAERRAQDWQNEHDIKMGYWR